MMETTDTRPLREALAAAEAEITEAHEVRDGWLAQAKALEPLLPGWTPGSPIIAAACAEIADLRQRLEQAEQRAAAGAEDTAILDWFGTHEGCEPMRAVRYDGAYMWRNVGVWYDDFRAACNAARGAKGVRDVG